MNLKAVPAEYKADANTGIFDGYASVFGNRDSYGDIVQPGAFTRTLQHDRGRIKVLWQHNPSQPIGVPLEMNEDDRGLHVRAQIARTTLGLDTLELIRAGVVTELSIGYDPIVEERDTITDATLLKEVRLWEFSPVTWAANDLARITNIKNASDLDALLDRLDRLEWARGRLKGDRMRDRVLKAIDTLNGLLATPAASTPVTPPPAESDSGTAHALSAIRDFRHHVTTTAALADMRAFGATLKEHTK